MKSNPWRTPSSAKTRSLRVRLALVIGIFAALAFGPSALAQAASTPAITVTDGAPGSVLAGSNLQVDLTAADPAGEPYGYNLAFRYVLPKGVSYVAGSETTEAGEPEIITNAKTGETTLIWHNVDDLSPASSRTISFELEYDTSVYDVGDVIETEVGAYISTNARDEADFNADGTPGASGPGSYTGSATATAETKITAIEVKKSEPHPEGEIPRGVHDNQTIYTLTVTNNHVNPTDGVELEDFLPAGLEFLGCAGTEDHTKEAPTYPGHAEEYEGSGKIVVGAVEDCLPPDIVETVDEDPDGAGPLESGVYTRVVWENIGDFAKNEEKVIRYRAAIPERRNTMTWPKGEPTPESGAQAVNLDNNSGAETKDEEELQNGAIVSGTYVSPAHPSGLPVSDEGTLTRTAEDLAIQKTNNKPTLEQGDYTEWTVNLQVSEYRYLNNVVIKDEVPDGLCPLGEKNYTRETYGDDSECDPVSGKEPSEPYTNVTEQSDGTYDITWDESTFSALSHLKPDEPLHFTFWTRTRKNYQKDFEDAGPILSHDAVKNNIQTEGKAYVRCQGGNGDCSKSPANKIESDWHDGEKVKDVSTSGKEADGPILEKTVAADYPTSGNCDELGMAHYGKTIPSYGPGDYVCWKLRVEFPKKLDTHSLNVFDLLPHGIEYVAGTWETAGEDSVSVESFADKEGRLEWVIGAKDDVDAGGQIFEVTLKTQVGSPLGHKSGDVEGNLEKFSYENTEGKSFALRDLTDFKLALPELALAKTIATVDGETPKNDKDEAVRGSDEVGYDVVVTNEGEAAAATSRVWDLLPTGIDCADVNTISDGGTCVEVSGQSRIQWSLGTPLAVGASKTLTYKVDVPADVSPDQTFTNTAGIVEYTYKTDAGESYKLIPENSTVKDSTAGTPNTTKAEDSATVHTPASSIVKTRTTSVKEGGNEKADQATIGENVEYTVTTKIPHGTTLYDGTVTDALETSRQSYVEGSLSGTLNGGSLAAAGISLEYSAGTITATLPAEYEVEGNKDAELVLTFTTKVLDVETNTREGTLGNTAVLTAKDQLNRPISHESSTSTTIVEPELGISKTDNANPSRVEPGQIVGFTVNASDSGAEDVSTAHEVTVVDTIPKGTTPVDGSGKALADGAVAGPQGGIWNETTRTITWTTVTTPGLSAIEPGKSVALHYSVKVDDPAVSGTMLRNTAEDQAKSLDSSVGGVRTSSSTASTSGDYKAEASDTLNLALDSITKTVSPEKVTIGNEAVWTIKVTVPKDLWSYDTTVIDTVPDGFAVDSETINCTGGCPAGDPAIQSFAPEVQADGTTKVGWFLGDLAPSNLERIYEIQLHGHLLNTYRHNGAKILDNETLVNKAIVGSDRTDKIGENPATLPSSFDDTAGPAEAINKVVEPKLAITKTAGGGAKVEPGQALTYTVKVTNNGDSAAYDTVIEDEPDSELTNVVLVQKANLATQSWTPGNHKILWTVPGPLAPGESITFTYTAEVVGGGSLHDGELIKNTAKIGEYFGVPKATREAHSTWEYRKYMGPNSTVEKTVDLPTLSLHKTTGASGHPDEASAEIEVPFKWRIEVTDTATKATAHNVTVTDTLPPNWEYKAGSTTFSTGSGADPTVTEEASGDKLVWGNVGNLAHGHTVVVEFEAIPLPASATNPGHGAADPHINSAVSSALDSSGSSSSLDGPYVSNTDTAKAILHVPDLEIEKTPDNGTAVAGEPSSFQIKVTNTGEGIAKHVVVDDTLPSGLLYEPAKAGVANPAPSKATTGELEWELGSLAPGASVTIALPVFVEASVPNGELLVNHAQTHADHVPPREDTGSLHVETKGDVSIVKTDNPDPVVAGENLTYTLAVHNNGPSDAQNVVVTDNLPSPDLSFVSADSGCTHVGNAITCELGTLAAGASKTIHVVTKVDPDKEEGEKIHNTAKVTTTTTDTNPSNNESSAETTVITRADVSIVKTADKKHYLGGETVTYTLVAHNNGPSTARNVKVHDPLPEEVTFQSVSPGSPTCGEAAEVVDCSLGSLEPGEGRTITIVTKAKGSPPAAPGEGHHTHKITVEKGEPDISIPAGHTVTETVSCQNGGEMVDGSARIFHVDQGQSYADVHILEADSVGLGTYRFVIDNETEGQAQVKLDYLCLPPSTDVTEGHSHSIIVGSLIPVPGNMTNLGEGVYSFHVSTPLGYRAVAPGIDVTKGEASIIKSEDDGEGGWNFAVQVTSPTASFSLSVRPLKEVTGATDGHAHDLIFEHRSERFTIPAGEEPTRQLRVSCGEGYEGIVATYDLPPGVFMYGNDPQPINRDFDILNTTGHAVEIELDLICLRIETGTEIDALEPVYNTATVTTTTTDPNPGNNEGTAGITISREEGSASSSGGSSSGSSGSSSKAAVTPEPSGSSPSSVTPSSSPAVQLGAARIAGSGGTATVQVSCTAACSGTLALSVPAGSGRSIVVGSAPYRVGAGGAKTVRVPIAHRYRKLVRHRSWLNATVKPAGGAATGFRIRIAR